MAGRGYELQDVNIRFLATVVFGLFALMLVGAGVSFWFAGFLEAQQKAADRPASPLAGTLPTRPPEPRLQENPGEALTKARTAEDAALVSYQWIDPKSGLLRIPIDRAIDLLAERGLPHRPATDEGTAAVKKKEKR